MYWFTSTHTLICSSNAFFAFEHYICCNNLYRAAWDIKAVTVLQNHIQVNASIIRPQFVLIPESLFRERKNQKNNFLPQAWSADYDYIMNKTQIHYCKMFPVYSLCEQPAKITAFIRPTCLSDSLTASTITIQEDGTMTWYWKCFRFRVIENQDHVHTMWTVVFKDSFNIFFTQPKFLCLLKLAINAIEAGML